MHSGKSTYFDTKMEPFWCQCYTLRFRAIEVIHGTQIA